MTSIKIVVVSVIVLSMINAGCSQENELINRAPVVSGRFYAGNKTELSENLRELYSKIIISPTISPENTLALISPHAGYVFSGEMAATSYSYLPENKKFDNIFILASSHYEYFEGASIYCLGNYNTPLGEVPVNLALAQQLIESNKYISYVPEAHRKEHSIEVQLPFLQQHLKKEFKIVPIVVGTREKSILESIAESLKPYLTHSNLFIVSSDLSHYPTYNDAKLADLNVLNAIEKNSSRALTDAISDNNETNIANLATSMCGYTAAYILLSITENIPGIKVTKTGYMNSGDTPLGDHDRVVGYGSVVFSKADSATAFELSSEEKSFLLSTARNAVGTKLGVYNKEKEISDIPEKSKEKYGVFVTIRINNELRGCIGRFEAQQALYKLVFEMAQSAAFADPRFPALTENEFYDITFEISVLTPMRKIESIDEIELGKHGIYIKKDFHKGTFLPKVATETGWNLEEFLGHCARDKAHIGWNGWKDADIFIYEAYDFKE